MEMNTQNEKSQLSFLQNFEIGYFLKYCKVLCGTVVTIILLKDQLTKPNQHKTCLPEEERENPHREACIQTHCNLE